MAIFKKSVNKEDLKQGSSNHITKSGIYPVTILSAFVEKSKTPGSKSEVVNLYVDYKGQKQVIYGNMRLTNGNGELNEIGFRIFNQLLVIADIDDAIDTENDVSEEDLPIGKNGANRKVNVLQSIPEIEILLRVQVKYYLINNVIKEAKDIKAFYRIEDNASADEIVNELEPGETFEKDQKYVDVVTYKDNLTPEAIEQWIKNGRKGVHSTTEAKKPAFAKKASKFGNKQIEE